MTVESTARSSQTDAGVGICRSWDVSLGLPLHSQPAPLLPAKTPAGHITAAVFCAKPEQNASRCCTGVKTQTAPPSPGIWPRHFCQAAPGFLSMGRDPGRQSGHEPVAGGWDFDSSWPARAVPRCNSAYLRTVFMSTPALRLISLRLIPLASRVSSVAFFMRLQNVHPFLSSFSCG